MMHLTLTKAIAGLAVLAGLAAAHPGHDVAQEAAERRAFLQSSKRTSLAHCADKLKARGVEARNVARREAVLQKARQKRGLKKRDFDMVLSTSHNKTSAGYTPNTDASALFAGYNSCLLTPEGEQGPYYVAGEYIRENLVDSQPGVSLLLDYQVIDVATCDPIPNVYIEVWHCNATGVYSGVVADGNGDSADDTNINKTFLRGIQQTSSDGIAQFESIFPGHYTGRAVHVHVLVHTNVSSVQANGTLGFDTHASYVGQVFLDQDLISAVSQLAPYTDNTQPLTLNADDRVLSQETATDGVDPVMEYTLLGDSIEDGLFAWLAFGINSTQSSSVSPASYLYADGGVANADGNAGGAGGAGGPSGSPTNGSFSDGVPPTGSPPPALAATSSASTSAASSSSSAPANRAGANAGAKAGDCKSRGSGKQ